MRSRAWSLALCLMVGVAADALRATEAAACGPWFAVELLSRRDETMNELPDTGVFMEEASRLLPPPKRHYAVVFGEPDGVRKTGGKRERKLYEAGAAAFSAGQHERARAAFVDLLELPAAERQTRSTWAAYMLGRMHGRNGSADYQRVRQLVDDGFDDVLGLAVASLGREAGVRYHLWGDAATAVQLYAAQAAQGDSSGAASLLFVVRALVEQRRESELLFRPLGQRLLALYLFTRANELTPEQNQRLWRVLAALENVQDGDKLAAAAYRRGRWQLAQDFAESSATPLARWVRAKLALRRGDRSAARGHLLAAAKGLAGNAEAAAHVHAELAILALRDGRRRDALQHVWLASPVHSDLWYVAERAVTIDELRGFLAELDHGAHRPNREHAAQDRQNLDGILARRLMRADRVEEALSLLPAGDRAVAVSYTVAMRIARSAEDPIEAAGALLTAAHAMRRHGMELVGTTHAPDWKLYDGRFDPYAWVRQYGEPRPGSGLEWTSDAERQLVELSAPRVRFRYHYRYLASQLAEEAADKLPHQSQAFAAALCHSARYVFNDSRVRVDELWSRYVRQGPAVAFAPTFGQECPEPDLEGARRYAKKTSQRWSVRQALLWSTPLSLGFALLAALRLARLFRKLRLLLRRVARTRF